MNPFSFKRTPLSLSKYKARGRPKKSSNAFTIGGSQPTASSIQSGQSTALVPRKRGRPRKTAVQTTVGQPQPKVKSWPQPTSYQPPVIDLKQLRTNIAQSGIFGPKPIAKPKPQPFKAKELKIEERVGDWGGWRQYARYFGFSPTGKSMNPDQSALTEAEARATAEALIGQFKGDKNTEVQVQVKTERDGTWYEVYIRERPVEYKYK